MYEGDLKNKYLSNQTASDHRNNLNPLQKIGLGKSFLFKQNYSKNSLNLTKQWLIWSQIQDKTEITLLGSLLG